MIHTGEAARRIAVIGGGISGLAAAHRLIELAPKPRLTLFEASDRLGGVLQTERSEGYLLEHSADNFITNVPWAVELCRRVGLADRLLPTRGDQRRALVVHRRRLVPIPAGFHLLSPSQLGPLMRSPLLSWRGKARLLAEWFIPARRAGGDESLASFTRRRLGREAFERLVQPLVSGIYTADAERLSMAAALPRFLNMERQDGGLLRGGFKAAAHRSSGPAAQSSENDASSGARYGLFVAPRDGMSSLVAAIAERLPPEALRLSTPVLKLTLNAEIQPGEAGGEPGPWLVSTASGVERFDAVVVALPAPSAAALLESSDAELAGLLRRIAYAGSAIVLAGYRREQIAHALDAFGFVVPAVERRGMLATSFSSVKFADRASQDRVLLRVFFGGADRPEQLDLDDSALTAMAREELGELLGVRGDPELLRVARWPATMPQYHVGHVELVAEIERLASRYSNLALAGNAYHGVGIPNCIHSGEQAAERLAGPASESRG